MTIVKDCGKESCFDARRIEVLMDRIARAAAFALLLLTPLPLAAQAADTPADRWQLVWNPPSDLYAPYAADPRRSRHIVSIMSILDSDLPDAQNLRWGLSIGGTYGIARLVPHDAPERAWQLDVEARFYAQFDIHYALDEIGHDGRVGATLVRGVTPNLATRVSFIHTSSHIGDEYILRNHVTERPSERREEVGAGVSWNASDRLRLYGDAGYGLNLNPGTKPGRIQGGVEFEDRPRFGSGRWYAALDATSFEDDDYDLSTSVQTGLLFQSRGSDRKYRFGIELYDGRSQLDAFARYHERYAVIGMWLDL